MEPTYHVSNSHGTWLNQPNLNIVPVKLDRFPTNGGKRSHKCCQKSNRIIYPRNEVNIYNCHIWIYNPAINTPESTNECPLKRAYFNRNTSTPTILFQGTCYIAFCGVILLRSLKEPTHCHSIHGAGICTYMKTIQNQPLMQLYKYTISMDGMGKVTLVPVCLVGGWVSTPSKNMRKSFFFSNHESPILRDENSKKIFELPPPSHKLLKVKPDYLSKDRIYHHLVCWILPGCCFYFSSLRLFLVALCLPLKPGEKKRNKDDSSKDHPLRQTYSEGTRLDSTLLVDSSYYPIKEQT